MVPGEGLEPSRACENPGDFKSPASANSAIPAEQYIFLILKHLRGGGRTRTAV